MNLSQQRELSTNYSDVGADPVQYCRERLNINVWSRQIELIESTWQNKITGCISGQKTGKTHVAAGIGVTWCKTKRKGIVRLAGASADQLNDGLWGDIRSLLLAHPELGPAPNLDAATGWRPDGPDGSRKIIGVTAKEANRLAGRSGEEQLWIVDEACGIGYELWQVIIGNLMGGGHLLWLTNPVTIGGKVYEWVTKPDSSANIVQIDARETPNFEFGPDGKPNPNYTGTLVPGLAEPAGVQMIFDDYGEESAEADVRVRGRFPRQGSNAVIPLGLVEDAIARQVDDDGPLVLGVDVARFGDDDSCVAPRRGLRVLEPEVVHGFDTVAVAGKVVETARKLRRRGERVTAVIEINGVGGGVYDNLRAQIEDDSTGLDWISILAFDSGAAANEDDAYVNRRSELWFTGRAFLASGGALPNNRRLKGELVAPMYGFDAKARRKVESKEDIKKKTKWSPDVADAVLLSLTTPGNASMMASDEPEAIVIDSIWGLEFEQQRGFG